MIVLLLMLAQEPSTVVAGLRPVTVIEQPCAIDRNSTDVTVCGRRNADRFRVPLLTRGEPAPTLPDNAAAEREALLHRTNPIQDLSPFLVGGGFAGASARFGSGSVKPTIGGVRPIAP